MCETCDKLREFMENPAPYVVPNWELLSPREKEAVGARARGLSGREVAIEMNISYNTAKNITWLALKKTDMPTSEIVYSVLERIQEILDEPV